MLSVISSSPGELEPVFQAMLENAVHICDAKFGNIYPLRRRCISHVAMHMTHREAFAELRRNSPFRPEPAYARLGRMVTTKIGNAHCRSGCGARLCRT